MMKPMSMTACAVAFAAAVALAGCSDGAGSAAGSAGDAGAPSASQQAAEAVQIKQSPDKYTWYVKNYVGMNAGIAGYTGLDTNRYDRYGAGALRLVFVAGDGTFVDPENEDQLKEYVVIGQNLEPNTEVIYTFQKDDDGKEYDNLVSTKSHEEIVLAVKRVGSSGDTVDMTAIQASPDKYTRMVRDYVGRNLAECGYLALGGYLADSYGAGSVKINPIADDGSYIDLSDSETYKDVLSQYKVTSQSVAPNTAMTMTFMLDSDGNEYENLVSTKSLDSIDLQVTKIG